MIYVYPTLGIHSSLCMKLFALMIMKRCDMHEARRTRINQLFARIFINDSVELTL